MTNFANGNSINAGYILCAFTIMCSWMVTIIVILSVIFQKVDF